MKPRKQDALPLAMPGLTPAQALAGAMQVPPPPRKPKRRSPRAGKKRPAAKKKA